VLQSDAHQTGNKVFIVTLAIFGLDEVLTTGRERKPLAHDVSSSSEMTSGPALSGESESWLRLVADLWISCRVLPESAEVSA
jgi:hypothetical protein